jgi:hypothetical protein
MADTYSYSAGHFEFQLDGHPTTAYLKSVEGGFAKVALLSEPIGPHNQQVKHSSVATIDPFSLEFGISGANDVLEWIKKSWDKKYSRKNGQITHADFNLNSTFEHQFREALITETTFPTLDGASKEAAYMKIKVQPEVILTQKASGAKVGGNFGVKQKLWMTSGFRLNLEGHSDTHFVNKIESFTIKQTIKPLHVGSQRFPTYEPTKLEFPNLVCTIAAGHAEGLHKWYLECVHGGKADNKAQTTGSLEFLNPARDKVIFSIKLDQVGLMSWQVQQSTANAEQIKRVKFELYVGAMDLDPGAIGFETGSAT